MGGKSSKQKVKITKAESGGKHSHGKTKEQKEPVENGETVTEKSAQSGATSNETGDNATKKTVVAKSEKAAKEFAEKRAAIESKGETKKESALQPETVVEPVQHLSEATTVETQLASQQRSPPPDEIKTEILQEESAKEEKPEEFVKIEVVEKKLDEPAARQGEPQAQQLAEIIEAEPNTAHAEQVQNNCDKVEEEKEGNPPVTFIDTPTIEAASGDTAVQAKEINGPVELTKCEGDGLEQTILLSAEQDS